MDPVLGCWHNDTLDSFKVSLTSNWTNLPSNLCWWKDNQESAWQLRRSLLSIFMMLTTNQSGKIIHSFPSHSSPAALYRSQTGEGREPDRSIQGWGQWGVSTNVSDTDQHDNMPPTGSDKEFSFYYKNTQWLVVLAMKHLQSLKTVCKQNIYYMLQANNTVLLQ